MIIAWKGKENEHMRIGLLVFLGFAESYAFEKWGFSPVILPLTAMIKRFWKSLTSYCTTRYSQMVLFPSSETLNFEHPPRQLQSILLHFCPCPTEGSQGTSVLTMEGEGEC